MTTLTDQFQNLHAEEAIALPVAVAGAGSRLPWCEVCVDDYHADWDGGTMHHVSSTTVGLSAYAYEVTTTETGQPVTKRETDWLTVSRAQRADQEPAAICLGLPEMVKRPADPHDLLSPCGHWALMSLAEAQRTGVALLVMTRPADGTLHTVSSPGDPSPCCASEVLRQSAYKTAVFCPGCGSLYWLNRDSTVDLPPAEDSELAMGVREALADAGQDAPDWHAGAGVPAAAR